MFSNTGEHFRPDFFAIVKRKHKIGPALASHGAVRARLSLGAPADGQQGCENPRGLRRRPMTYAATKPIRMAMGRFSPHSIRSARTRSARVSALAMASSDVAPYTRIPGISGTSASQRASS